MSTNVNISLTLSNDEQVELSATATPGTYLATINIKGLLYVEEVVVTSGPDIITINNVFQANTLHSLRIFDSSGDLLDDTIYLIQTNTVQSTSVNEVRKIDFTSVGGETGLENSLFIGASDIQMFLEGGLSYSVNKVAENEIEYPFPLTDRQSVTIKVLR